MPDSLATSLNRPPVDGAVTDRSRHPWRGAAALVGGAVLSAVGMGAGGNQLAVGLGPAAVVGLLVLGIGLVLVVGGVVGGLAGQACERFQGSVLSSTLRRTYSDAAASWARPSANSARCS